jgi:hypothetical protein
MKTNKAFTFMCELDDTDNNRVNTQQFTTSTSWTRHEITFAGDTSGTLDDDNARSMQLNFWLHAGSTYTGGTYSANTWQSRASSDNMRAVGIGSFFDSTDNEIQVTGVQLEVGEQATPFEHRSFGDELLRCQRYYEKSFNHSVAPGTATATGLIEGSGTAGNETTTEMTLHAKFAVHKRANPTVTIYDTSGNSGKINRIQMGITTHNNQSVNTYFQGESGVTIISSSGSSASALSAHFVADAEL